MHGGYTPARLLAEVAHRVFHPVLVVAVGVVLEGVGAARLLAEVGAVHGGGRAREEVPESGVTWR